MRSKTDIRLLSDLRWIQYSQHLTDAGMAEKLGCTRQLYQMTRTYKIPLGLKILRGSIKAFPRLLPDAMYFLSPDAAQSMPILAFKNQRGGALRRLGDGLLGLVAKLGK